MLWFVGLSLALFPGPLPEKCLDSAIPPHKLRKLAYGNKTQALRIGIGAWTNAAIVNAIGGILLKEAVGVEVEYNLDTAVPASAQLAAVIGGCPFPSNESISTCLARPEEQRRHDDPIGHVSFSAWEPYYQTQLAELPQQARPLTYATGYNGEEGAFVTGSAIKRAFEEEGANLLDYADYNAEWRNAKKYFTSILEVNNASNNPPSDCSDEVAIRGKQAQDYLDSTGDTEGMDQTGDTITFHCSKTGSTQGWWIAPACRANPEVDCIPLITSAGWGFHHFAQLATHHKMPLAIANFPWSEYARLPNMLDVLFFWWYPDDTFLGAKQLRFPPVNRIEQRAGMWRTMGESANINTLMWPSLPTVDSAVADFIKSWSTDIATVNIWMDRVGANSSITAEELACEWVRNNEPLWRPWVIDVCSAGEFPGVAACESCPLGHFCPAGIRKPLPCNPGTTSPTLGAGTCILCEQGEEQPGLGQDTCNKCSAGFFAKLPGQAKCEACPPGFFSEVGSDVCTPCEKGMFAGKAGSSYCSSCPDTFTTEFRAADSANKCTCLGGKFWNRAADTCDKCQPQGVCPGGFSAPTVVGRNNYGVYVGSMSSDALTNKKQGEYTPESGSNAFSKLRIYSCRPDQCLPQPGECPAYTAPNGRRTGIACAVCEEGYYLAECQPCRGGGTFVLLIIIIVTLPFVMWASCVVTSKPYAAKATAAFQLASTFGIMLLFVQLLGTLSGFNMAWPLGPLFSIGNIFLFDLEVLGVGCIVGNGFVPQYYTSFMLPICIAGCMALLLPVSSVLPSIAGHATKLEVNNVFNFLGMLYSALYISLVKMVVAYFECVPNPSAPDTLAKYKQVECNSNEHTMGTPATILGMLFYVIGFFSLCVYLNIKAPEKFTNASFRVRCKFLVNRWRADVWYWSTVYMVRNLLIAMVAVASAAAVDQLIMMGVIMVVFVVSTASFMPWKDQRLAQFDNATSFAVILACMSGIGLTYLSDARNAAFAAQDLAAAENAEQRMRGYKIFLVIPLVVAFVSFVGLGVYCVWWIRNRVALAKQATEKNNLLVEWCHVIVTNPQFKQELVEFINMGTYYDIQMLRKLMSDLHDRLGGTSSFGNVSPELAEFTRQSAHARITSGERSGIDSDKVLERYSCQNRYTDQTV